MSINKPMGIQCVVGLDNKAKMIISVFVSN